MAWYMQHKVGVRIFRTMLVFSARRAFRSQSRTAKALAGQRLRHDLGQLFIANGGKHD
jgi:hypothetical protein